MLAYLSKSSDIHACYTSWILDKGHLFPITNGRLMWWPLKWATFTEGGLDVGFEILVDINLLIKRFLEGFRLSFGGMKGFFFYSSMSSTSSSGDTLL